jgi:uncharacterized protein (UPF0210 family)
MRVRSVTIGTSVGYPVEEGLFDVLEAFQAKARVLFEEVGLEVQTVRLATQPFPEIVADAGSHRVVPLARQLEALCQQHGLDFCSLGTVAAVEPGVDLRYIDVIPEVIRQTESAFVSALVADYGSGINLAAIRRAAQVIYNVARIERNGFGNLRFAVLANCGPGSPFFPASYHRDGETSFAVATEAADLAVDSLRAATLGEAKENLRASVEGAARKIEGVCQALAAEFGFRFGGIDFSLAPYPETMRSIGHAVEQLGVGAFGSSATLFAAGFMTSILREAEFPRCGFCGLLFPVLEDKTMAQRSAQDLYTLDSLLLYSAVCGTGLDTVPLPGDVTVDELAAILLDVATLAVVVNKPLTARLMPIPGKGAGEVTDFDFPYFANARILDVRGHGAPKILRQNDFVRLAR